VNNLHIITLNKLHYN